MGTDEDDIIIYSFLQCKCQKGKLSISWLIYWVKKKIIQADTDPDSPHDP